MRMRAHVEALAGEELTRPHLIEEDEWADHLPCLSRQCTANLESTDVVGARQNHLFHASRQNSRARIVFGRSCVIPSG